LGGVASPPNPLNIPISGPLANAVTRGYHLGVMPGNRLRVLTDWMLNGITRAEATSLDVISAQAVALDPNHPRA
jgi:NADH:ubiquinone reductase (H+-translocating)